MGVGFKLLVNAQKSATQLMSAKDVHKCKILARGNRLHDPKGKCVVINI